jgi:hypothetical protein
MITVIEGADRLGVRKQTVFKVLKRLGIETRKERHSAHRGQCMAYITVSDFQRVQEELTARRNGLPLDSGENTSKDLSPVEFGLFYLIQLEPDHDPFRFKVGFTAYMPERLRHLKCSAPFATILGTWTCKLLWEKTAIECVTAGCEQVHTEVFRSKSLEEIRAKCQRFFDQMPVPEDKNGA